MQKKRANREDASAAQTAVVELKSESESLIQRIERDIATVPTDLLVPFFAKGDMIVKRISELKDRVKEELVSRRFDEGEPFGENGEHRRFRFDGGTLEIQLRTTHGFDEEKAGEVLAAKKLLDRAVDAVVIEARGQDLFRFLSTHAKELKMIGAKVTHRISRDKVAALVQIGDLTLEEAASFLTKKEVYSARVVQDKGK